VIKLKRIPSMSMKYINQPIKYYSVIEQQPTSTLGVNKTNTRSIKINKTERL
jgi:hypothetical protein